jgi:inner membrane protein
MLVAHAPAGYLLTQLGGDRTRRYVALGLAGSIFPDVDLLWFYFVDHRAHMHHSYWTHIPFYWGVLWIACELMALGWPARVFLANVMLHLVLDTIAGGIEWAFPLTTHRYVWTHVPPGHGFWLWNFVLHWTFLLELPIVAAALVVSVRALRGRRTDASTTCAEPP